MTTLYFQGKWILFDDGTFAYLSANFVGIVASELDISGATTFILYSTTLESTSDFSGYVQPQGNENYVGVGDCLPNGLSKFPGQCQLIPNAPDINSAVTFTWNSTGFTSGSRNGNPLSPAGIGIIDYPNYNGAYPYWGFYAGGGTGGYSSMQITTVTPGLAQIMQSHSWPNTDFSLVNLTGQDLSGPYQFPGSNFQKTILDQVNLSGANLSGANFTGASLAGTNFTGATLSSANFSGCDLTTIIFDGTTIVAPTQSARGSFNTARLPFALINRLWQWLDLSSSTVSGVPSPLSTSDNVLQATGARLTGMNKNDFTGVTLQSAVLSYADLDGVDLSDADLTNATLIQASLHGTNLSGATLVNTNMSGAQLGALGYLFTLPLSMQSNLNAGTVSALIPYFTQLGLTISANATLKPLVANQVWELDDISSQIIYTIRLNGPNAQVYTVYWPAVGAKMTDAYMPNAVLTGANLYGVLANNVQFYGSGAKVDSSAILEEAQFNDSNMSNVDFTQAQLMGTNLSGSYLFNANFKGANLTPSINGVATNLSEANLQGADFTDAQLGAASLKNAAVAINVPTKANPNQGGVYLFSLPYSGDTNTLQNYIDELDAAGLTLFSLNPNGDKPTFEKYVTALKTNDLTTLQIPFSHRKPPITFSSEAKINTITPGRVWQIVDMDRSYTLWTDRDDENHKELYAASSLTLTHAAFQHNGLTLRWQASVAIDTLDQQWLLDNDSENPKNFSTGYVSFVLRVNGSVLDVYGTAIRIVRLGKNNQQEFDTENCNVTVLGVTNMSGSTICPNGTMLSVNQTQSGENWDQRWLRASALPKPPKCVPTGSHYCNPKSKNNE